MIKYVVAVYDSARQGYAEPFMSPAVGVAVRDFTDALNRQDANNALFNHPEDFELRLLATFDDETGIFNGKGIPDTLIRGKDAKHVSQ